MGGGLPDFIYGFDFVFWLKILKAFYKNMQMEGIVLVTKPPTNRSKITTKVTLQKKGRAKYIKKKAKDFIKYFIE